MPITKCCKAQTTKLFFRPTTEQQFVEFIKILKMLKKKQFAMHLVRKDKFRDTQRKNAALSKKLQRLQKVQIWAFGSLVHQIDS